MLDLLLLTFNEISFVFIGMLTLNNEYRKWLNSSSLRFIKFLLYKYKLISFQQDLSIILNGFEKKYIRLSFNPDTANNITIECHENSIGKRILHILSLMPHCLKLTLFLIENNFSNQAPLPLCHTSYRRGNSSQLNK